MAIPEPPWWRKPNRESSADRKPLTRDLAEGSYVIFVRRGG